MNTEYINLLKLRIKQSAETCKLGQGLNHILDNNESYLPPNTIFAGLKLYTELVYAVVGIVEFISTIESPHSEANKLTKIVTILHDRQSFINLGKLALEDEVKFKSYIECYKDRVVQKYNYNAEQDGELQEYIKKNYDSYQNCCILFYLTNRFVENGEYDKCKEKIDQILKLVIQSIVQDLKSETFFTLIAKYTAMFININLFASSNCSVDANDSDSLMNQTL